MIKIALAQINPIVGDLSGNMKKIVHYIKRAQQSEACFVAFPELALCGYPPEDLLYKEHFVKDNMCALYKIAREIKEITAVIGFVDMDKKKNLYNAAAIISHGKIKEVYHKHKLPNYGVFDEKRYFVEGKQHKIFYMGNVPFGVTICEDIWHDKGPYWQEVREGAKIIINISSSPYDIDKLQDRERIVKKRARETKTPICYLNLVGGQDELVFDGSSFVVDEKGKITARAKEFEEDLLIVEFPLRKKRSAFVSLSPLARVYQALVLGVRDYVRKNGFKKVVIGLSGGIDSALVAAIAVDAIGKENVVGVSMPSRFSSSGTQEDAKQLAQNLGISFKEISIETIFKAYLETFSKEFKDCPLDITEENIQARIRGNILMALSNKFGWLVLTTGNKSEVAVGYCTLYGDMSGGFAVIKDVPKTKVYELAKYYNNKESRAIIPSDIFKRAPSAELRMNQKDQDSLPCYDVLDGLLADYVEKHASYATMSRSQNKDVVKKVIKLVDKSEYKRRQSPPGIKISSLAFGKDWRLPITNQYKEF